MDQPAENKPRTKSPSAQLREEPIAAVDPWRGAPVSLRAQQNEIGPERSLGTRRTAGLLILKSGRSKFRNRRTDKGPAIHLSIIQTNQSLR